MENREERERLLVEEIKALLREKGKSLDPEMLAKLIAAQSGEVEGSASRYAAFWRANRTLAALLLAALFALLFFFLISGGPESPAPPAGMRQGRVGGASRR